MIYLLLERLFLSIKSKVSREKIAINETQLLLKINKKALNHLTMDNNIKNLMLSITQPTMRSPIRWKRPLCGTAKSFLR